MIKHKDLIGVPRNVYEDFLLWQKMIKSKRQFQPTAAEKRALARGRRNYAQGETVSLEQLDNELGIRN